jgi:hypothetical protein
MEADKIPVVVSSTEVKGVFDTAASAVRTTVDLSALKKSLSDLVAKLAQVMDAAETADSRLRLAEMEVGVELTAEGGVNLIGTATVGLNTSIKLTFKRGT